MTGLGGFFTVAAPPGAGTGAVPWAEVLAEEALTERFAAVRHALAQSSGMPSAEVDRQVAVSATQVGLASRLWSVALASVVLHGWVPDLSPVNLLASPVHRGPVPLGVRDPGAGRAVGSTDQAVREIDRVLVHGSLAVLDEACARVGRTSARVLASNAASALVGGARVLASARPGQAADAWDLARGLLARPSDGLGARIVDPAGLPPGTGGAMGREDEVLLRSGCCLFHRTPGHGLCPDCVLAPAHPERVTPGH